MKLRMIVPQVAASEVRGGNTATNERWCQFLTELGHTCVVDDHFSTGDPADVIVAFHAYKTAARVDRLLVDDNMKLIVCLTGTDIYRDLPADPAAYRILDRADRIVALHSFVVKAVPERFRHKVSVIVQSAEITAPVVSPDLNDFNLVVIGNLRDVKDPLLTAAAARLLDGSSKVRVHHVGAALQPVWAERAIAEAKQNPRYIWHGGKDRADTETILMQSRALVLTSLMEGGANVISEAIVADRPVLSTRIPCTEALLGPDYKGLFSVGDVKQLAELIVRLESDSHFYNELLLDCQRLKPMFHPDAERQALKQLLQFSPL